MKIIGIHIYGFGKLTDLKIDNFCDFQVFFGENEAGKSTIMRFIHAVLFGFPTKQQAELRFEPKHHNHYGGKLKIFTEEQGFADIQRIKGKTAAGDVTVITDNGEIGGEELLKKLLSNVDKELFQSIFSFNLHGLQNIHQMRSEEIGRFLFSAGTLGTERLAFAENEIQKEMDIRFKAGGKKPLLNGKLQDLHRLHQDLKQAASKNQEYESLRKQSAENQVQMNEIEEQLEQLQEKVDKLKEWKKIDALVKEQKWTENELKGLEHILFPVRGIERYEKLKPLVQTYEAQIQSIQERREGLKTELEKLKPNQAILDCESEILAALESYPLYSEWSLQGKQLETKLQQFEEKLAMLKEKLHLSLADEEVSSIDTTIFMKDSVEKLSRQSQSIEEAKQQLEHRFNEEKNALEMLEEECRLTQAKILSGKEREALEKRVSEGQDRHGLEVRLQSVREKKEFYKKAAEQEQQMKKQKLMQYIVFAVIFIGLSCYGLFSGQTVPLLLGCAGFIIVMIFLLINLGKRSQNQEPKGLKELYHEEQDLMQQFEKPAFREMNLLKEKLTQDNQYREQLQKWHIQLEQQQNQYEKIIKGFEEWELTAAEHQREMKKICQGLRIPENIGNSFLLEAFSLIEQYKVLSREKRLLLENLKAVASDKADIAVKLNRLAEHFLDKKTVDIQETVFLLRSKLKDEQEKNVHWKEKQGKLLELEADLQQLKEEQQHIESGMNHLLNEANVKSETEFYEFGLMADKKSKLVERHQDLDKQLNFSFLSEMERENFLQIHDCDEIISKHYQQLSEWKARLSRLQEKQASIKYEIGIIEEGGLYSELLHQFKQEKYELEEEAKEWAAYSLAQNILSKTIEKYKNVHLPRMLSKAEEFLSFLTNGNYNKILLHPKGPGFHIVRKDQTVFEANELSQATTEQVYTAIRLALAVTIYEKYRFPIIIDDSFVNFDLKRTEKISELLQAFEQNQILFFTCHEHLLKYFDKENIAYLNKGAIQVQ